MGSTFPTFFSVPNKQYNLFISHSWTHSPYYYSKLIEWFQSDPSFNFKNYSVPKDDPIHNAQNDTQLYNAIKNKIQYSSIILIFTGVYSSHSRWINKEIKIAQEYRKPILGINVWAQDRTSQIVRDAAHKIVGWNSAPIISSIRELV